MYFPHIVKMQAYERMQPARQPMELSVDLVPAEWSFYEKRMGTTDRGAISKHIARLQKTAYQNVRRQKLLIGDCH